MNDIELENLLKNIKVPPINSKRREETIAKAVSEFAQPHQGFGIWHRLNTQLSKFKEMRRNMAKNNFPFSVGVASAVICVFAVMFIIPQMNHEVITPTVTPPNPQTENLQHSKPNKPKPVATSPLMKRELTAKVYAPQNFMGQRSESAGAPGGRFQGRGVGSSQGIMPVSGEIISQDDTSITVKLQDGSSKIVILSGNTNINKSSEGSKSDLKTGERVTAFGTTNSDGSITAQNVSIGGNMMFRGGLPGQNNPGAPKQ
jgi:hypothetical protein